MSQQINLFNPIFLHQKRYFSIVTMLQALALIVLGTLLMYGYAQYQVDQLKDESTDTARRLTDDQNRLSRYTVEYSPQQANQALQDELNATEAALAAQQNVINTLKGGKLGNTRGYSEYMRAFARQTVTGLWLTGFAITGDGAQMILSGGVLRPELLPQYVGRLNHEGIMRGKTFSSLQMQQPRAEKDSQQPYHYVEFVLQSTETGEANK
jgi:hypothetical protein